MESFKIEDFLETYPEIDDQIQENITKRREFYEMGSTTKERVQPETFFRHQLYLQRLMFAYDRQLIIDDTGTGKTCAVVAAIQKFMKLYETGDSYIDGAIVLVKGKTLKSEFRNQLVCKCPEGREFITQLVLDAETPTQQKGNITRSLKRFYRIYTYKKFALNLSKLTDEEKVKNYSGKFFFLDEIHNYRSDPSIKDKEREKEVALVKKELTKLFDIIKRSKIIIASATPMINRINEIVPIMNLLLPPDNKMGEKKDYNDASDEELAPYFNGMISYIRSLDTDAYRNEVGDRIVYLSSLDEEISEDEEPSTSLVLPYIRGSWLYEDQEVPEGYSLSHSRVWPTDMSDFQLKSYKHAQQTGGKSLYRKIRDASNFVFPDGSYGTSAPPGVDSEGKYGFNDLKYVFEDNGVYYATDELNKYLSNKEELRLLSSKFSEIVNNALTDGGNRFCFSSDVITGSGLFVLGMCFEGQGFERFDEETSVFETEALGGLPPVCMEREDITRTLKPKFRQKRRRFAIITGSTPDAQFDTIMKTFNSPENKNGDIIQVILGSSVTRDGINLSNVLHVDIINSDFHQSGIHQAISRAFRATSHIDLKKEGERIAVNIYKHAAIDDESMSIDIGIYMYAENKDKEIKKVILRRMKRFAGNCQINYARNVRPLDEDGSDTCQFSNCRYDCVGPVPETDFEETKKWYVKVVNDLEKDVDNYTKTMDHLSFYGLYFNVDLRNTSQVSDYISDQILPWKSRLSDLSEREVKEFQRIIGRKYLIPVLNDTTYDIFYKSESLNVLTPLIVGIFRYIFTLNSEHLPYYLRYYNPDVDVIYFRPHIISLALEYIIRNNLPITDRFGHLSFLRMDLGNLFLTKSYPFQTYESNTDQYALQEYTSNLISNRFLTLKSYTQVEVQETIPVIIEEIRSLTPREFEEYLRLLSMNTAASLLEEMIMRLRKNEDVDLSERVYQHYADRNTMYTFNEPIGKIQEFKSQLETKSGRGRKPDDPYASRCNTLKIITQSLFIPPDEYIKQGTGERVFVHIFEALTKDESPTKYKIIPQYNRPKNGVRILKDSEDKWRTVNTHQHCEELAAYIYMVSSKRLERKQKFRDLRYWSYRDDNDEIYVVVNLYPQIEEKDARKRPRGIACSSINNPELSSILSDPTFNSDYPPKEEYDYTFTREDLLYTINKHKLSKKLYTDFNSEWTEVRFNLFAAWLQYAEKMGAETLCNKVKEVMFKQRWYERIV